MPKVKYLRFYELMWEKNQALLTDFKQLNDQFALDPKKFSVDFHTKGIKVLDIIRDWERRLCAGMNRGQFSAYSQGLSEKFWQKVRSDFSKIDEVGVR